MIMESKYDLVVTGNKNSLNALQTRAVLMWKGLMPTTLIITQVIRSKDKSTLFVRIEDEYSKAWEFRDFINITYPNLRVMIVQVTKREKNDK